jgi:hypothetical protein
MIKTKIYIVFMSFLLACTQFTETSEPVAKVGEKVLTMNELSANIPDYLDATDSVLWADDYIKKWVQRELILLKAEQNLKSELKDVSKELEEYRSSLLVFRYKNELMKQKIDTIVKESVILKYFNGHRESFILNRNIVKAIYIKIPLEVSSPETLKELCSSVDKVKLDKLNEYCMTYAKAYDRFNDQWVSADLVLKNTPVEISNQAAYLEKKAFIESTDKVYYYLVYIRDYRLEGEVSPVEYVQNDIRNLILSKQKLDFFKQVEKDIYKEGLENNKVKLFKIKNNHL